MVVSLSPPPQIISLLFPVRFPRGRHEAVRVHRRRVLRIKVWHRPLSFLAGSLLPFGRRRSLSERLPLLLLSVGRSKCWAPGCPSLIPLTWGRAKVFSEARHICNNDKKKKAIKKGKDVTKNSKYYESMYYHTKYSPKTSGTSTISMNTVSKRPTFFNIPSLWNQDQSHPYSERSQIVWHLARLSSLKHGLGL